MFKMSHKLSASKNETSHLLFVQSLVITRIESFPKALNICPSNKVQHFDKCYINPYKIGQYV